MKQILRPYALGLLTATIIFGIYYLIFYEDDVQIIRDVPSEEEMITALETSGYYIYEDDPTEAIINQQETEPNDNEAEVTDEMHEFEDEETNDDSNVEEPEAIDDIFILTIEDGMTVSEVADILVNEEIIETRNEFVSYLLENNYGTNIQIGEFELNRDMSLDELVETIARPNN